MVLRNTFIPKQTAIGWGAVNDKENYQAHDNGGKMNQPKFKFGDKVVRKDGHYFFICEIKKANGHYFYNEGHRLYDWLREDEISLYQEPQKKKLYAYKYCYSSDKLNNTEIKFMSHEAEYWGSWERAAEYDIEYPEATK